MYICTLEIQTLYLVFWTRHRMQKVRNIAHTHRTQDTQSAVACFDMTSMKAFAVSENFFINTGVGTLYSQNTC